MRTASTPEAVPAGVRCFPTALDALHKPKRWRNTALQKNAKDGLSLRRSRPAMRKAPAHRRDPRARGGRPPPGRYRAVTPGPYRPGGARVAGKATEGCERLPDRRLHCRPRKNHDRARVLSDCRLMKTQAHDFWRRSPEGPV